MAKKIKSPAITEVEAEGLDIDLTRSTPPPAEPEVEDYVGLSEADAALPETAPELPEPVVEDAADPVPEAPASEPAPEAPAAPESADDVFAAAMAEGAAEVAANPSKLESYTAALNFGGSFHMPGSVHGLTVAGTPYLAEDGRVFVRCLAHNGHQDVCVEGLLDPI